MTGAKTGTKADMHIHSTASDGTDNIPALLEKLRASGIDTFSVTDHDTIIGSFEMEKLVPGSMKFIPGVEFSCITEAGKCHILGYGYDPHNKVLCNLLEVVAGKRKAKLERRISFLAKERNVHMDEKVLNKLRGMSSAGKPHLANILVKMGLASDKETAIKTYIDACEVGDERIRAEDAIQAILAAGGIPVWAHPYGGSEESGIDRESFKRQLKTLVDKGLLGLECFYSKYTKEQVQALLKAAEQYSLLVSGGSDYHGTNKDVRLGQLNADGIAVDKKELTILEELAQRENSRQSS